MMKRTYYILAALILCLSADGLYALSADIPDFPWMKDVGAKAFPAHPAVYFADDYGAAGDAVAMNTEAIQKAIDAAEENGGGTVTFKPGIYLTGSLFIGENINFHIPKGTMLIGSQDIKDYRKIDTRVAGVEMSWPSALINIIGKKNAAISGDGVINGRGKVFWDRYREMRKEYDPKGLRWIVDYDCERPRGILISDCENVTVRDIVLYQPGFWSLHILYSKYVTVDGVIISNNIEGRGPSTDGIDIDSSEYILVQNSNINCNDDNFCLKAGRDSDGLRVNRPCQYIVIRDCVAGHGDGLFTSGCIRHVVAYNMKGIGTKYGLRFKSTCQRGGVVEDIHLANIEMVGVRDPFVVDLNWNPAYSTSLLPAGYDRNAVPEHWKKMLSPVDIKQGTPKFRNVYFTNVTAVNAQTCVKVAGIETSTIDGFVFRNTSFSGQSSGYIQRAKDWVSDGFYVNAADKLVLKDNENAGVKQ